MPIHPKHHKNTQPPAQANAWMLTFADLLSLVLTFFVMLYASSAMIEPKWRKVAASLTHRLNPDKMVHDIILTADKNVPLIEAKEAVDLSYLYSLVSQKIAAQKTLSGLQLHLQEEKLALSLPNDMLFHEGNTLSPEALEMISLLEDIFHQIGNRVDVYSYASREAQENNTSGWELALSRATSVADGLRQFGYAYDIQAFGLPDAPYTENITIQPKENEKGLYAPSHRVDIMIRNEKASGTP